MKKHLKYILSVLLLCCSTVFFAQELAVKSFTVAPTDISASSQPRNDLNGHPCGLVKVQLAVAGAQFEGNVIAPVENKTGEYWVYMTEGSKELVVKTPSTMPLHVNFGDYQISGIVPKATYVLALSSPNVAEQQTGTLTIRYSPSSAMVLIDSKPYQGTNGVVSATLPVGSHDYIVAANDYETLEGSVKVKANQTVNLPLTLSPTPFQATVTSQQDVLPANTPTISQPTTGTATMSSSSVSSPVEVSTNPSSQTFTVKGVSFKMILVEGGTFLMGSTTDWNDEKPVHQVSLSTYYIGETEVTQELWEVVMNDNPSYIKRANHPVEEVTWDDCQDFIGRLNHITGKQFRLPTEAEWEFSARGGNNSKGFRYSGGNSEDEVAWHKYNSDKESHPVKTKSPNELGIYDMSGNVQEWCQDWFGSYNSDEQTNPNGPFSGLARVYRGGDWRGGDCRVSYRRGSGHDYKNNDLGFRLAMYPPSKAFSPAAPQTTTISRQDILTNATALSTTSPSTVSSTVEVSTNPSSQTFTVKGVSFKMIRVEGGTFTMGATSEQETDAFDNEKPVHQVTLSTYYIAETEVTQALWKAVMGRNPSKYKGNIRPVENVSWDDCQKFVKKLSRKTGRNFRLPTEAEWEFAARGGKKSQSYKYSGGNTLEDVAWYDKNAFLCGANYINDSHPDFGTHPVKTKSSNELGIYDMSGNVREWCQDWEGSYSSSSQTNPAGPSTGYDRVNRGGDWGIKARGCRVSYRGYDTPEFRGIYLGLRLAL